MDSVDDNVRELVAKELHEVKPIYASGVETAEAMGSYDQDFFAKSIKAMQNYQRQHRRIFCKACIEPEDKKKRLIYRRLCIELNDDLLGNDTKHVQLRCFKCDFDMHVKATPELMITGNLSEVDWNRLSGAMVSACDSGIRPDELYNEIMQASQRRSMERSRQDMQRAQHGAFGAGFAAQGLAGGAFGGQASSQSSATEARMRQQASDHSQDVMRYMMEHSPDLIDPEKFADLVGFPKALSSAPTSQAPRPPKKKK